MKDKNYNNVSGEMHESRIFFSGGPDAPPPARKPLGVFIGKSGALHFEMQIESLNY